MPLIWTINQYRCLLRYLIIGGTSLVIAILIFQAMRVSLPINIPRLCAIFFLISHLGIFLLALLYAVYQWSISHLQNKDTQPES
jgi:hypothetical protein